MKSTTSLKLTIFINWTSSLQFATSFVIKLVANCKDDVQLIKMVNFKAAVLFIRIATKI